MAKKPTSNDDLRRFGENAATDDDCAVGSFLLATSGNSVAFGATRVTPLVANRNGPGRTIALQPGWKLEVPRRIELR